MEVPVFSKWWEVALYLLFALGILILGLMYLPFYLSSKLWNYLKSLKAWDKLSQERHKSMTEFWIDLAYIIGAIICFGLAAWAILLDDDNAEM